ncbi:MAG: Cell division protein FtsI, partial [Acidimicrobiales bacterium]|nr:Cell division protein FtsI [Acidimicrobiales bacterium]
APIRIDGDGAAARRRTQRRLSGLVIAFVLAFAAVVARLADLQVIGSRRYVAYGLEQRTGWRELPAARGVLYDRDGRALAMSIPQPTVFADPKGVVDPAQTASTLAPILGLDRAVIEPKLRATNRFQILAHTVSDGVAKQLAKLALPGIGTYDEYRRYQPSGSLARSLIGGVSTDGTAGSSGLEQQYNAVLNGKFGRLVFEKAHGGGTIAGGHRQVVPAKPGQNLYLTIDQSLQFEAERALTDQVLATQAKGGMAIITRPSTGEILAMANVGPQADGSMGPTADNAAVTSTFEPGSVNKVITLSGALEEGLIQPSTTFTVPFGLQVADHYFTDSHPHPTVQWTATDILADSSNVGSIKIGQQLGPQRLDSYLRKFGFGEKTDLGFPGETRGLMLPLKQWSGTSIGSIPIGQGISVTALQMLSAYNVVANDGVYVPPKLVAATDSGDGRRSTPPPASRRVVSVATARSMRGMMTQVVRAGTGSQAKVPGYDIAGKTGTARIPQHGGTNKADGYLDAQGNYHYMATFAGMVEGGDLSIIVVVREPTTSIYAADTAAPVFARLATYALRLYRIPPPAIVAADATNIPQVSASALTSSGDRLPTAGGTTTTLSPTTTTAARTP